MAPFIAAALMAAVVLAITSFQHYALRNAVLVIVGAALYVANVVWQDAVSDAWIDARITAAAIAGGLVVLGVDREKRRLRQHKTSELPRHELAEAPGTPLDSEKT